MSNKDYLSQEEIDALLKQTIEEESDPEQVPEQSQNEGISVSEYLDMMEKDTLGEIGNITFGSAATALSTLLNKKVDITTPVVDVVLHDELQRKFPKPHVSVHVDYVDGFQGVNMLVIKKHDAMVIADLMMGGEGTSLPDELNDLHLSAVQEAMNQMMGSSATSMSTIFNRMVNISPPGIDLIDFSDEESNNFPQVDVFVRISFRLKIGDLIDSSIMQLLPVQFAKELVAGLMGGQDTNAQESAASGNQPAVEDAELDSHTQPQQPAASTPLPMQQPAASAPPPMQQPAASAPPPMQQPAASAPPPMQQPAASTPPPMQQPAASAPPQQPFEQPYQQPFAAPPQPASGPQTYGGMAVNRNVNVQPVQFADLSFSQDGSAQQTNLDLLLDIPLKVTVELGRTQRMIKDILELSQGSIIELDKLAGEPVDILVNNKLIAKGEVVVIDENFGVRVTDIISQWDRMQKIR